MNRKKRIELNGESYSTRSLGSVYEQKASVYLKKLGYTILECNFRCRLGEIDIIAKQGEYLCFIEVKYRASAAAGEAVEAVDYRKQNKIIRVAHYYLMKHGYSEWTPCRFDVVAIDGDIISLYQNAYDA